MLITPSFKKGLIVEQFQGDYLYPNRKPPNILPTDFVVHFVILWWTVLLSRIKVRNPVVLLFIFAKMEQFNERVQLLKLSSKGYVYR